MQAALPRCRLVPPVGCGNTAPSPSVKRHARTPGMQLGRALLVLAVLFLRTPSAVAEELIRVVFTPERIIPPVYYLGGTEKIEIRVINQSQERIELPQNRWLIVEKKDRPDGPLFTPVAPYSPLILEPGGSVKVVWRLAEPGYDVLLPGGGARTINPSIGAGEYHLFVHYRQVGEEAWRRHKTVIEMSSIKTWILVLMLCAVLILGWLFKRWSDR